MEVKDFDVIAKQITPLVKNIARKYRVDGYSEDDLIQEGLIAVWLRLQKGYKVTTSIERFATMIVNTTFIDLCRNKLGRSQESRQRKKVVKWGMENIGKLIAAKKDNPDWELKDTIDALPLSQRHRDILHLLTEGYNQKQIAEKLGLNANQVGYAVKVIGKFINEGDYFDRQKETK